jgi:hypothetical protein
MKSIQTETVNRTFLWFTDRLSTVNPQFANLVVLYSSGCAVLWFSKNYKFYLTENWSSTKTGPDQFL